MRRRRSAAAVALVAWSRSIVVASATGCPSACASVALAVPPLTARPRSSTDGTSAAPAAAWPLTARRRATVPVPPPAEVGSVLLATRRRIRLKVEPPGAVAGGGVDADDDAAGAGAAGVLGAVPDGDEPGRPAGDRVSVPLPAWATVRRAGPGSGVVAPPAGVGPSARVATVTATPPGRSTPAVPRLAARSSGRATEGRRRAA